jgi:hypothetical protein
MVTDMKMTPIEVTDVLISNKDYYNEVTYIFLQKTRSEHKYSGVTPITKKA